MMSPLGKYVEQIEKADVELSRECIDRIKHKDVTFTKERVSRTEIGPWVHKNQVRCQHLNMAV